MLMTDPAAAIKFEVSELVRLQIDTLCKPTSLTTPLLSEYHRRAERLDQLYTELDRVTTDRVIEEFGLGMGRCPTVPPELLRRKT
jgi:hypothetical protein